MLKVLSGVEINGQTRTYCVQIFTMQQKRPVYYTQKESYIPSGCRFATYGREQRPNKLKFKQTSLRFLTRSVKKYQMIMIVTWHHEYLCNMSVVSNSRSIIRGNMLKSASRALRGNIGNLLSSSCKNAAVVFAFGSDF